MCDVWGCAPTAYVSLELQTKKKGYNSMSQSSFFNCGKQQDVLRASRCRPVLATLQRREVKGGLGGGVGGSLPMLVIQVAQPTAEEGHGET